MRLSRSVARNWQDDVRRFSARVAWKTAPGMLGEHAGGRWTRDSADVARERRKTEEGKVELAAIASYLHLAGLELGGRRCAIGEVPSLAHFPKGQVVTQHVYAVAPTCCAVAGEGKMGLPHCSRPGEDSEVGAAAPRPPPARIKVPIF